jgi:hypothetical protein
MRSSNWYQNQIESEKGDSQAIDCRTELNERRETFKQLSEKLLERQKGETAEQSDEEPNRKLGEGRWSSN